MIDLKYNNWSEVPLITWRELVNIQSESEISNMIERLSIISDSDSSEIRNLPIERFKKLEIDTQWFEEELKQEVKLTFDLNNKKYGLIPDFNFISTGEWADIDNWKDDTISNIHLICALLYRPVTKYVSDDEYEIEDYSEKGFMKRAELFLEELPITIPYGSVLFFSAFGIQYIETLAESLQEIVTATSPVKKKMITQKVSKKRK